MHTGNRALEQSDLVGGVDLQVANGRGAMARHRPDKRVLGGSAAPGTAVTNEAKEANHPNRSESKTSRKDPPAVIELKEGVLGGERGRTNFVTLRENRGLVTHKFPATILRGKPLHYRPGRLLDERRVPKHPQNGENLTRKGAVPPQPPYPPTCPRTRSQRCGGPRAHDATTPWPTHGF